MNATLSFGNHIPKPLTFLTIMVFVLVSYLTLAQADIEGMEPTYSKFPVLEGDQPSLLTGDLHLNLDLLTVPGRSGLDYPVTLNYNSGIRSQDEASWVGLGWNLGVGTIVRSLNRVPDDDPNGYLNRPSSDCPQIYDPTDPYASAWCDYNHQDKFFLNLGNGMEQVILKADGTAQFHKWSPWKIEYDSDTSDGINWFKITKDDGTVYEFMESIETTVTSHTTTTTTTPTVSYTACYLVDQYRCDKDHSDCTNTRYCSDHQEWVSGYCTLGGQCSHDYSSCSENLDCYHYQSTPQSCLLDRTTQVTSTEYIYGNSMPRTFNQTFTYRNVWLLTSIKSPDYKDRTNNGLTSDDYGSYVRFWYTPEVGTRKYNYPSTLPELITSTGSGINYITTPTTDCAGGGTIGQHYSTTTTYKSYTTLRFKYLSVIETPIAAAVMRLADREDLKGNNSTGQAPKRLDRIDLYNSPHYNESGVEQIRSIDFDNDHYDLAAGSPGGTPGRLTLYGIKEIGADGTEERSTEFFYDYNPSYQFCAVDSWGFYNGQTDNNCSMGDDLSPGANGEAAAWSLTGIKYPTGGRTDYVYEPDTYSYIQDTALESEVIAGGIRVKSMTVSDGINPSDGLTHEWTTEFRYGSDAHGLGISSGVILNEPQYQFPTSTPGYYVTHWQQYPASEGTKQVRNGFLHVGSHIETDVKYSQVVVDYPGNEAGKTLMEFITAKDVGFGDQDFSSQGRPFTFRGWMRGYTKREAHMAQSSNPVIVEEVLHDFTCYPNGTNYWSMSVDHDPADTSHLEVAHKIESGWCTKDAKIRTLDEVTEEKAFIYNAQNGRPTQIVESSPDMPGIERITELSYVFQYSGRQDPAYQIFLDRNILSAVFTRQVKNQDGLILEYGYSPVMAADSDRAYVRGFLKWLDLDRDGEIDWSTSPGGSDAYVGTLTNAFDDYGNPIEKTTPLGAVHTKLFKPETSLLESETISANGTTYISSIIYDPIHHTLPASITKGDGTVTHYEYDGLGRLDKSYQIDGVETEYNYMHYGGAELSPTNLNQIVTTQTIGTIDENGNNVEQIRRTVEEFDGLGRKVISKVKGPGGWIVTTNRFDTAGRPQMKSFPFVSSDGMVAYGDLGPRGLKDTQYYKNPMERVEHDWTISKKNGTAIIEYTTAYGKDPNTNWKTVTRTDPLGHVTVTAMDAFGIESTITKEGRTLSYMRKNLRGDVILQRDANGVETKNMVDSLGRTIATLRPDMESFEAISHAGLGSVTEEWKLDAMGNAIRYRDSELAANGKYIRYVYDQLGRKTQKEIRSDVDAFEVGTWTGYHHDDYSSTICAATAPVRTLPNYEARAKGKPTCISGPQEKLTLFYDDFGRLAEKVVVRGHIGSQYRFEYDYNDAGELVRKTLDPVHGVDVIFGVNPLGQVAYIKVQETEIARFLYNAEGDLERIERANGVHTTLGRDGFNRLNLLSTEGLASNNGNPIPVSVLNRFIEYNDIGHITRIYRGQSPSDPILRDFENGYNAFGQLIEGELHSEIQPDRNRMVSYDYDDVGNRISRTEAGIGEIEPAAVHTYTYRNLTNGFSRDTNQVERVRDADGNVLRHYVYNRNGNVKQVVLPPSQVSVEYEYDLFNRMNAVTFSNGSSETYIYDSGKRRIWKRDRKNRQIEYVYEENDVVFDHEVNEYMRGDINGDGDRDIEDIADMISLVVGSGGVNMPDPEDVADVDSSGALSIDDAYFLANFVYQSGTAPSPIMQTKNTAYLNIAGSRFLAIEGGDLSKITYYLTDQVGSASAVMDSQGLKKAAQEYYPFGKVLARDGYVTKYQFTGKEYDEDTGLHYYGARFYDSEIGRFIARDTVDDGPSPYVYVKNNPLIAVDPSGHMGMSIASLQSLASRAQSSSSGGSSSSAKFSSRSLSSEVSVGKSASGRFGFMGGEIMMFTRDKEAASHGRELSGAVARYNIGKGLALTGRVQRDEGFQSSSIGLEFGNVGGVSIGVSIGNAKFGSTNLTTYGLSASKGIFGFSASFARRGFDLPFDSSANSLSGDTGDGFNDQGGNGSGGGTPSVSNGGYVSTYLEAPEEVGSLNWSLSATKEFKNGIQFGASVNGYVGYNEVATFDNGAISHQTHTSKVSWSGNVQVTAPINIPFL